MALYEYDLYIVREQSRGDLLADAISRGVLRVDGDPSSGKDLDGSCFGGRVPCIVRRVQLASDPSLELLNVPLDNDAFVAFLQQTPNELVPALWHIADALDPAYVFMPGGGDIKYFERGEPTDTLTFKQLPRLVYHGEIAVVHPIMYFAERLGNGSVCKKA